MKNILIIDALGGGVGRQLVSAVKKALPQLPVTAAGINIAATTAMLKAGADQAATGENAVIVNCRRADVILGPVGIIVADALLGEVTPAIAAAVAQSRARRILIPFNQCDTIIMGVRDASMTELVQEAVAELQKMQENEMPS